MYNVTIIFDVSIISDSSPSSNGSSWPKHNLKHFNDHIGLNAIINKFASQYVTAISLQYCQQILNDIINVTFNEV